MRNNKFRIVFLTIILLFCYLSGYSGEERLIKNFGDWPFIKIDNSNRIHLLITKEKNFGPLAYYQYDLTKNAFIDSIPVLDSSTYAAQFPMSAINFDNVLIAYEENYPNIFTSLLFVQTINPRDLKRSKTLEIKEMASWFGLCGNITIGDSMFCVVWVSGDDNAIYAQFLDASPALMGDYFQISDNIADHNATPAWIDYNLCNRHFVAVWADDRSVDYQLYGRVFNSERSDWSATLSLNDSLYINNYAIWFPKVFWNSDTSFTVFYRIEDGNLYRQSYNMQGNALGVVRRVNKLIDSAGDFSVARDSLGRMVAVWEDLTTDKILCQRFNSDASLLDSIFAVSSGTYQIPLLSLSTDFKDGRVCVVWNDADYRIWLQVFDFENPNKMTPEKSPTAPQDFLLAGNYPNPFNATTRIRFYLPQVGTVGIKVWDCRGHLVREKDFPAFRSGWNEIEFKADDLPSGIYLYEIKSGKNACQAKMLLMK